MGRLIVRRPVLAALREHRGDVGTIVGLGDGNGEFTQAMGLTMDGSKFGLGTRSQRYAMVVDNGVIKELFVEKPGAFEVSAAENVLKHLELERRATKSTAGRKSRRSLLRGRHRLGDKRLAVSQ